MLRHIQQNLKRIGLGLVTACLLWAGFANRAEAGGCYHPRPYGYGNSFSYGGGYGGGNFSGGGYGGGYSGGGYGGGGYGYSQPRGFSPYGGGYGMSSYGRSYGSYGRGW
jgi:hypothetical protein